ncbi:hypothetical protein L3X38_018472 [Prunus dulcis]|uniref:Uncharacterized protein n=1 Tax=Prunus dulcis TaxID=3755 RepID=A0AAD4W941_PRUDU|nr:hypothetical protein L3X38_018472 [Prunus dulcis]
MRVKRLAKKKLIATQVEPFDELVDDGSSVLVNRALTKSKLNNRPKMNRLVSRILKRSEVVETRTAVLNGFKEQCTRVSKIRSKKLDFFPLSQFWARERKWIGHYCGLGREM